MIKKIIQPDDSCEGCIYEGTHKCWVTPDAHGDTEPCFESKDGEPDIYYIYVDEEIEDENKVNIQTC